MQISDKLGQYNRNVTNGTDELRSAQGTQKLVSTVRDLSNGSIFEGTVSHIKNGKVLLSLGNGQTISARLDGKVDIKAGSSMFFQVKSNDGQTVSIRPYVGSGNASNPILSDALTAAQIPVTERNLAMVDSMMKEQMAIGRQSILDMVKVLNSNPNANVETIVRMVKLGLPVTEEMANQFENYLSDKHMILNEMELAVGELTAALGDAGLTSEDAFGLYSKIMDVIFDGSLGAQNGQTGTLGNMAGVPGQSAEITGAPGQENGQDGNASGMSGGTDGTGVLGNATGITGDAAGVLGQLAAADGQDGNGTIPQSTGNQTGGGAELGGQLGELLNEQQLSNLTKLLQNIPTLIGSTEIFENVAQEEVFVDTMTDDAIPGQDISLEEQMQAEQSQASLNKNLTAGEFLKSLQSALAGKGEYGYAGVSRLFASTEFQKLFRHAIEQQWLIKPEDLKEENKISTLYEKMERQISQMEHAVRLAGGTQSSFLQAAADVRGNIEFMNQMNQIYTYVQMPLKMSGQNANGELYVYTNKKQLRNPEAELTAFLHLDMEHLGSTDVSVRLKNRKVNTNFYLPDDASYALIEKHLPILEKRLKNKGYTCTITIQNEKKNQDFMENFLQKEQPPAAALHRYSFDVRA